MQPQYVKVTFVGWKQHSPYDCKYHVHVHF